MNFKKRIDQLNTNLVLKETTILIVLDELEKLIFKHDEDSQTRFILLIKELQHLKNEYHSVYIQLKTLTSYSKGLEQ